jgi:hypothetical protein
MQLSSNARKAMAVGLTISTFVWSAMLVIVPAVSSAAVHSDGCLVLSGGAVWKIENGTRRGFTSSEVFASHGYNFSQVVTATSEDQALPVGPIIVYADGSLVKGPSDPLVYLVANGQKRGFVSGSVFTGLGFSFSNIVQAPANTFNDLPTGANMDSATAMHTNGVLVNDNGTIFQMTATGKKGIPSMTVLNSWGLSLKKTVAANSADQAATSEGVVSERAACTSSSVPPVSGSVTVSLASSTPAAGTLVQKQAIASLATFTFSNGTSSAVSVNTLKLKKLGVAADTTLTKVYLYDGEARLTDDASVSAGVISWNSSSGVFTIPANSARNITVKSNIADSTSGQTVGVGLNAAADVVVSAGTIGGSFPINGNIMTIASATLASFDFATYVTSLNPTVNTDLAPQEGFNAWRSVVTVGTRAVYLRSMNFRVIGSIEAKDLKNFKLMVDGVQVGSTVSSMDANGYVLFDLSSAPKKIEAGSPTIKVMVDVIGGSNRNFQVSLRQAADVSVTDSDFGSNILVRGDDDSTTDAYTAHQTGLQTVSVGSLTISKKSDSPSGNVTLSATGVTLARYEMKALGENMKVENLRVYVDSSDANTAQRFRNGGLFVDGVLVGSTTDIYELNNATATYSEISLGSSVIVAPGTPKLLEIRADIYDNEGATNSVSAGDTLTAYVAVGSSNVQRMVSAGYINVPAGAQGGNTLTVASGSMTLAKDQAYGSQSIVVPTNAYKIGQWVLSGSSTEDINLDTIQVDLTFADEFAAADLTNIYVMYGSKTSSLKSSSSTTAGANTWSISEPLAKNTSMTFAFYGDIASAATVTGTNDTVIASLLVSGTTASSAQAVNTNSNAVLAGQTITAVTAGTLTVEKDTSSPQAAIAVAGSTPSDGNLKVKLTASNEDMYVKDLTFYTDANADDAVIASATLWSSTSSTGSYTQVGPAKTWNANDTVPGYVQWTLSGTDRVKVAKNGSVYLLIKPTYVGSSEATVTGQTPRLFLGDLQAEGSSTLVAQSATPNLVGDAGIIVKANTSATFVSSTETDTAADTTASATTIVTADGIAFSAGDVIFIDEDAGGDWDYATEELMVVLADAGANLTVKRGAFGTTAVAYAVNTKTIYRLSGTVATYTYAGVVGNATTVLKDKLSLSVSSDTPTGSTTGGTQRVIFKFNAAAANNAEDVAENKVVLTSVDLTTTKSGLTVNNVKLYPSEFDQNATYVTTCVALSSTEWRCTFSTEGATNEVVENGSRTYVVRADVGSGTGTSNTLDVSIASLGSSDAAGTVTAGDVVWTDGTTSKSWVNQAGASYIQPSSPMTMGASSGTTDATAPTISSIIFTDGTADNALTVGATIKITFSERMDPTTIGNSLIPGATTAAVTNGETGDISVAADNGAASGNDMLTIKNIVNVDMGATTFATGALTGAVTAALNTAGTELTLTVSTALTGAGADGTEVIEPASVSTTVKDANAVAATAAGSNSATVTGVDL